jgi:hypothetical protein
MAEQALVLSVSNRLPREIDLAPARDISAERARDRFPPVDQLLSRFDRIDSLLACA